MEVGALVGWPGSHELGKRPRGIHPTAIVGAPPESRKWLVGDEFLPPVIDPSALVDAYCTIDAGMPGLPPTSIGPRSWLQKRVHVGHNAVIGADCEIAVGVTICGEVVLGDGVQVGGNSWIKPQVTLHPGSIIGGGSVVTKDVPAHEVWCGNPARYLKNAWTHQSALTYYPDPEEAWELMRPWHVRPRG